MALVRNLLSRTVCFDWFEAGSRSTSLTLQETRKKGKHKRGRGNKKEQRMETRSKKISGDEPGRRRHRSRERQDFVVRFDRMYGYLTLGGLALCMLVYFFGNPTRELLCGRPPPTPDISCSTLSPQIPQPPPLSPQLAPDQPVLQPPSKPQAPVKMSTVERT